MALEETKAKFATAYAAHEKFLAEKKVKEEVAKEKAKADHDAYLAKKAAARKAAEAKFKAEGWWEQQPGVFMRWCDPDSSCPGRASAHHTDYVWRAMVWCKERACGYYLRPHQHSERRDRCGLDK